MLNLDLLIFQNTSYNNYSVSLKWTFEWQYIYRSKTNKVVQHFLNWLFVSTKTVCMGAGSLLPEDFLPPYTFIQFLKT